MRLSEGQKLTSPKAGFWFYKERIDRDAFENRQLWRLFQESIPYVLDVAARVGKAVLHLLAGLVSLHPRESCAQSQ